MIKHIIFDLDGVLVDAKDIHAKAFIDACGKEYAYVDKDYHDQYLCGLPTKVKVSRLGLQHLSEKIYKTKQELTIEAFNKISKDQGLIDLCKSLRSKGITMSCASNSIYNTVHTALVKLGIAEYMSITIGNDNGVAHKPSPEMYEKIMNSLKLSRSEILVIEDSPIGEQAIANAKMNGLIVKNRSEVTKENIYNKIQAVNNEYTNTDGGKRPKI